MAPKSPDKKFKRARTSSPVSTPRKLDGNRRVRLNPHENRDYRISRLRSQAQDLNKRIPNIPGAPDNKRDLSLAKLKELYEYCVAKMAPGDSDEQVDRLLKLLVEFGHPDFVSPDKANWGAHVFDVDSDNTPTGSPEKLLTRAEVKDIWERLSDILDDVYDDLEDSDLEEDGLVVADTSPDSDVFTTTANLPESSSNPNSQVESVTVGEVDETSADSADGDQDDPMIDSNNDAEYVANTEIYADPALFAAGKTLMPMKRVDNDGRYAFLLNQGVQDPAYSGVVYQNNMALNSMDLDNNHKGKGKDNVSDKSDGAQAAVESQNSTEFGRIWGPVYPPANVGPHIAVAPGAYPYPIQAGPSIQGAAYVSGHNTFQPFSRDGALKEHFQHHPIQDPEGFFQAYREKYQKDLKPLDFHDDTDDKVLMCVCTKYDDGRGYIQCDNGFKCTKQFYHPECLGIPKNLIPGVNDTWFCPDCLKDGLGGAARFAKMAAIMNKTDAAKVKAPAKVAGKKRKAAEAIQSPIVNIKPWSADETKSESMSDALARAEFGISTLEEAKTTLRNRSTKDIRLPVTPPSRPAVVKGTIVRQPNKLSWHADEDAILAHCVHILHAQDLRGQPLWEALDPMLKARGVHRTMAAARNRWMRGLREEFDLDERRKQNANKMTTAIQVAKADRTPESGRKKKGRYAVSRKADVPAGHVQVLSSMKKKKFKDSLKEGSDED